MRVDQTQLRHYGKKVLRRYAMRALRSSVVLLYHRVADLDTDPQLLAVSPRNFAEHLEILGQSYVPVRLGGLHDHTRGWSKNGRSRGGRSVVVTFDDGYADNLHHGLPLLRAAGIPATVFVIAGQIGSLEEFWWDELERILLQEPSLPEWLHLTVGPKQLSWHLPPEEDRPDRRWHVLSDQPCSTRQAVYRDLCELLRPLDTPARMQVLDSLRSWANVDGIGRAHNRALAEEEVVALAKDGLVEIGSHTMTHLLLSAQPTAVQREEIEGSKRRLERILNARVQCFSYPFGERTDFTSVTVRLVRESGYRCACSIFPGRVFRGTDRFRIPRFTVRNWTGDEFSRRLEAFFDE